MEFGIWNLLLPEPDGFQFPDAEEDEGSYSGEGCNEGDHKQ